MFKSNKILLLLRAGRSATFLQQGPHLKQAFPRKFDRKNQFADGIPVNEQIKFKAELITISSTHHT